MPTQPVLIADPDVATAKIIEKHLARQFNVDVMHVQQSQLAIALFRSRQPWVCLASAVQNRHNGFKLCGALRHLPGGARSTMIVYGSAGDDIDHRSLAEEHRLNTWIPKPDAKMLARLLEPHLSAKVPIKAAAAVPKSFSQKFEQFSARTPGQEDQPWEDPDPTPMEDKDWADLMRSDVSVESLKTAMTKGIHVGGRVRDLDEGESHKDLSWSKLVRSEVTPHTLKALMTKEIRLLRGKQDKAATEDEKT